MTQTNKQNANTVASPTGDKNATATVIINEFEIVSRFNTIINAFGPEDIFEDTIIRKCLGPIPYTDLTPSKMSKIVLGVHATLKSKGSQITPKEIEKSIRDVTDRDPLWYGINCYIEEHRKCMYLIKDGRNGKKIKEKISNFIFRPSYTLVVDNKDISQRFYVFDVIVGGRNKQTYTVRLTAPDFEQMSSLQNQLATQIGTAGCRLYGVANNMIGLGHKYIDLGVDLIDIVKRGTSVLGYERLDDDGEKYFCNTKGQVFNKEGIISEDLEYIGMDVPTADTAKIKTLTNLDYDADTWKNEIAPGLLRNLMRLHLKDNMLIIGGWIFAIPHEYNIRQLLKAFPLLHIAGQQGSGKSTVIQAVRKFLGYDSETIPMYPTPAALVKASSVGYTIISTYDEYAGSSSGNGWSIERFNATHEALKHIYQKDVASKLGKGDGGQGSFNYKMRSSLISLGQQFITDDSIASRTAQVYVYDAFHKTPEGVLAVKAAENLDVMIDKNFWAGLNIWGMNRPDDEVKDMTRQFKKASLASGVKFRDKRQYDAAAAIMVGLHYMLELAAELGVSEAEIGFTKTDILTVPAAMANILGIKNSGSLAITSLHRFLREVGSDANTIGNTQFGGTLYGRWSAMYECKPQKKDAGKYGKDGKEACIFGQELILMDIEELCGHINKKIGKDKYSVDDLTIQIQSEFENAKVSKGDGLVLAPNGYRNGDNARRYTAFSKEKLIDMVPQFSTVVYASQLPKKDKKTP